MWACPPTPPPPPPQVNPSEVEWSARCVRCCEPWLRVQCVFYKSRENHILNCCALERIQIQRQGQKEAARQDRKSNGVKRWLLRRRRRCCCRRRCRLRRLSTKRKKWQRTWRIWLMWIEWEMWPSPIPRAPSQPFLRASRPNHWSGGTCHCLASAYFNLIILMSIWCNMCR